MTDIDRMISEKQFQRSPVVNYDRIVDEEELDDEGIAGILNMMDSLNNSGATELSDRDKEVDTDAAPQKLVVNSRKREDEPLSRDNLVHRWIPIENARAIQTDVNRARAAQLEADRAAGLIGMAARPRPKWLDRKKNR